MVGLTLSEQGDQDGVAGTGGDEHGVSALDLRVAAERAHGMSTVFLIYTIPALISN